MRSAGELAAEAARAKRLDPLAMLKPRPSRTMHELVDSRKQDAYDLAVGLLMDLCAGSARRRLSGLCETRFVTAIADTVRCTMNQGHGVERGQARTHGRGNARQLAQRYQTQHYETLDAELLERDPEVEDAFDSVPAEPPEPPEIEREGDGERGPWERPSQDESTRPPNGQPYELSDLPADLRLPVLFELRDGRVHRVAATRAERKAPRTEAMRDAIAAAMADRLLGTGLDLSIPGAWLGFVPFAHCKELAFYASAHYLDAYPDAGDLQKVFYDMGGLRRFTMRLPSGEVAAPDAMKAKRKDAWVKHLEKRATSTPETPLSIRVWSPRRDESNAARALAWMESRSARLPRPCGDGFWWIGQVRAMLPILRVVWLVKPKSKVPRTLPDFEPESWKRLFRPGRKVTKKSSPDYLWRFFRADQALRWIESTVPEDEPNRDAIVASRVRRALAKWLVPVEDPLVAHRALLEQRVQTIAAWAHAGVTFSRSRVPEAFRHIDPELREGKGEPSHRGLDPVHTPESKHVGLTRYLAVGWSVSDEGWPIPPDSEPGGAQTEDKVLDAGPLTAEIPFALHDKPRRLMLGASLTSRSVSLSPEPGSAEPRRSRALRVKFDVADGWTHEDAVVVSQSGAEKLGMCQTFERRVRIPPQCSSVKTAQKGTLEAGEPMLRAFVDAFAMGKPQPRSLGEWGLDPCGRIEVHVPDTLLPFAAELVSVERDPDDALTYWLRYTRRIDLDVGDKISTRHGIKGVVSKICPDGEMPAAEQGDPAEILLSPSGTARRGAMGQFREAGESGAAQTSPWGTIHVLRQNHHARDALRMRGQRYGEMEFWALMAHGAKDVAAELLSAKRSTAPWMEQERRLAPDASHQELCTVALNRFLAVAGLCVDGGHLKARHVGESGTLITCEQRRDFKEACKWIEPERVDSLSALSELGAPVFLKLGRTVEASILPVRDTKSDQSKPRVTVQFDRMPVVAPWLRPSGPSGPHPLTQRYLELAWCLSHGGRMPPRLEYIETNDPLTTLVERCLRAALSPKFGACAFLKRELLGRRLTRSARAVIVPNPTLAMDQVGLPSRVMKGIFQGLDEEQRGLVLLNRNPTLHRRGLIAMHPVQSQHDNVFELPLAVLGGLGADFDGDQATVVALETEAALKEAERLVPGSAEMRRDVLRRDFPCFPLLKELSSPEKEMDLARETELSDGDWREKHKALQAEVIKALQDEEGGWASPFTQRWLDANDGYWEGPSAREWYEDARCSEIPKVIDTVSQKGRLGGLFRRELYRRPFREDFFHLVAALQAVTERVAQSSLSVKKGAGAFDIELSITESAEDFEKVVAMINDKIRAERAENNASEFKGEQLAKSLFKAIGESDPPKGILAWMAKPTPEGLVECMSGVEGEPPDEKDPRWQWFLR